MCFISAMSSGWRPARNPSRRSGPFVRSAEEEADVKRGDLLCCLGSSVEVRCHVARLRHGDGATAGARAGPDQPAKVDSTVGWAASVTLVPAAKLALQVAPQSIPGGLLVTLPLPVPDLPTASAKPLDAAVVLLKPPLTPPMVRVVVTVAPGLLLAVCRTQTDCPG